MGTPVTLGRMRARVVRHFQNGVAVEFAAAQEMGEHLKPQAQEAMGAVKDTATTGAEHVKAEGQDKASQLKDESTQATRHVKGTTERY